MKVLIVGGGGREHALAWKIKKSPLLSELYCAPGNAGTKSIATNLDLSPENVGALALWALENEIDLTIVGPEAPLAEGIVDAFQEHGVRIFGPSKEAAQLEASKTFAKEVMLKAGVKTAASETFESYEEAKNYVEQKGAPIVIKADGLAAGKGVFVAQTVEQAVSALSEILEDKRFGGSSVLIEDFLLGREASVIALVDGTTVLPMVVSQDYKRLQDNDEGPNTGGMGAVSPSSVIPDTRVEHLVGEIFLPVLRELWARQIRFVGFLYAGVMVAPSGDVYVLEFNVRMGDPETQVLLLRLQSDLLYAINAAVDGKLSTIDLKWRADNAACIVAASRGYPESVDDGKKIEGLFEESEDCVIFHAGTKSDGAGGVVTKGGRVLAVSALGADKEAAVKRAYQGMDEINFEGMQYRRDIGGGLKQAGE